MKKILCAMLILSATCKPFTSDEQFLQNVVNGTNIVTGAMWVTFFTLLGNLSARNSNFAKKYGSLFLLPTYLKPRMAPIYFTAFSMAFLTQKARQRSGNRQRRT